MKIAAWMLEPLHWLKVVLAVALWILVAPILWDVLRAVAAIPGGGEVLFGLGGFVLVLARAMRRSLSLDAMIARRSVHEHPRTQHQLRHVARHEAAHAVVAWAGGAKVVAIDVIPAFDVGGQCTVSATDERLVQSAWISLQVKMAALVEDGRNQVRSLGGASDDVAQAVTQVAVIIATGERPKGYEGALTLEGLIDGATVQAQQVLEENEDLVEAIAVQLLADPSTPLIEPDLDGLHRELTGKRELVSS